MVLLASKRLHRASFQLRFTDLSTLPSSPIRSPFQTRLLAQLQQKRTMQVVPIPMWSDNYSYVVYDESTKEAALFDPAEPERVLARLATLTKPESKGGKGLVLKYIYNTHHHQDHSGGNDDVFSAFPDAAQYVTSAHTTSSKRALIPETGPDAPTHPLGRYAIRPLSTPCHTLDHICYFISRSDAAAELADADTDTKTDPPVVLTGDTLFHAGCGRFFEGSAAQMDHSLNTVLAGLPDNTVVYPGHEYTGSNLKWARGLLEHDKALQKLADAVEHARAKDQGRTVGKFTIGDEKGHNLFMRLNDPEVQRVTGESDPAQVMQALRTLKNNS